VIVFADADLQDAVKRGLSGAISANGQGCVNGTRLLVERPIYDKYLQMLAAMAAHIPIAIRSIRARWSGRSSRRRRDADSRNRRYRCEAGGRAAHRGRRALGDDRRDGFFLPITIVADVDNNTNIAQHEVFGRCWRDAVDTEEEAVTLATARLWPRWLCPYTESAPRASCRGQLDAGMIHVNGSGEGIRLAYRSAE